MTDNTIHQNTDINNMY